MTIFDAVMSAVQEGITKDSDIVDWVKTNHGLKVNPKTVANYRSRIKNGQAETAPMAATVTHFTAYEIKETLDFMDRIGSARLVELVNALTNNK